MTGPRVVLTSPFEISNVSQYVRPFYLLISSLTPSIQEELTPLGIPLHTITYTPRRTIPAKLVALLQEWKTGIMYANIEHEVDELRRDIKVTNLANAAGISAVFCQDRCVVEPFQLTTQQGKPYAVRSHLKPFCAASIFMLHI